MQIILSHVNTDFDALASMVAAKKLYPEAQLVISDKQTTLVKQFLNIYRDTLDCKRDSLIDPSQVSELILVDVASLKRIGKLGEKIDEEKVKITVFDHHPKSDSNVKKDAGLIEQVGSTVTLLVELIKERNIKITPFEATLFGLGIYTDTGFFTYNNTTPRDFLAASYLMEQRMNLEMIQQFTEQNLQPEQQQLLDKLFLQTEIIKVDGLEIAVSTCQHDAFLGGIAVLTEKLLDIKGADAVITVVGMKRHVFVVGRASSERISLLPLLKKWKGGGHKHAGSATIKNAPRQQVYEEVIENINLILQPAITAADIMTSPVKTISPETTIEKAGQLMYRYKHSGYPVLKDEKLVGIITRRDLDKANHHGLGHAPVKAYMSTNIVTIKEEATIEEIQKIVIEHNIGRLPVVKGEELIGIISRTNIIEAIHSKTLKEDDGLIDENELKLNIQQNMKEQLPENIFSLLKNIGKTARDENVLVYLIGGIVRDIFLRHDNDDIDIVVEGDGILFANKLQEAYGGELIAHESFGTATWTHPSQLKIDIASSRLEYYERPASLPDVEKSTLKEDLYRRDFTINAMAICLNEDKFGEIVDPFSGQLDLYNKTVKVLHNLSFVEDPTRILRAIRFENRFNFKMDEQTELLALHSIEKITDLTEERILNEIKRLFNEDNEEAVMKRLFEVKFWQQFGIEETIAEQAYNFTKTLQAHYENKLGAQEIKPRPFNYFSIPFYCNQTTEDAFQFALTKSDRKFLQEVVTLQNENLASQSKAGDFHYLLKKFSDEAILFRTANESDDLKALLHQYLLKRNEVETYLTGQDLVKLGLKPSPSFSDIFLNLEVKVIDGEITSKDQALNWAGQYINK